MENQILGRNSRQTRKYGAFVKINNVWHRRFESLAYAKPVAVQKFQNWLLAGALGQREEGETERGLRPIK